MFHLVKPLFYGKLRPEYCLRTRKLVEDPLFKAVCKRFTISLLLQTYYGLEVNAVEDELQRNAITVMIRTYGQMPKQLFLTRHPEQQVIPGSAAAAITENLAESP